MFYLGFIDWLLLPLNTKTSCFAKSSVCHKLTQHCKCSEFVLDYFRSVSFFLFYTLAESRATVNACVFFIWQPGKADTRQEALPPQIWLMYLRCFTSTWPVQMNREQGKRKKRKREEGRDAVGDAAAQAGFINTVGLFVFPHRLVLRVPTQWFACQSATNVKPIRQQWA